jgi:uncharacterized protein HemX
MDLNALLQQYGLVGGIVAILALLGLPKLLDYLSKRGELELKRKNEEVDEDKTEETLDQQTRDITNRLALKAFDIQEQLARLKAEYEAQSELLRLTRQQLADCKGVEVSEYRHQVTELLEELSARENVIAKLRHDVAILEALK